MAKLTKQEIDGLVTSVQEYFFSETPQPKFVVVDHRTVKEDPTEPNCYYAKVTIEVEYIPKKIKSHTVYIQFKLTAKKKVDATSIRYL